MMRTMPTRIILLSPQILLIMLLIHPMSIITGMVLRPDLIELIHPLRLRQLINLTTHETSQHFLREGVVYGFAWGG